MNDSTYPLPIGTQLPQGEITGLTDTAYRVQPATLHDCRADRDECWCGPEPEVFVPFTKVHPLVPASPLVVIR